MLMDNILFYDIYRYRFSVPITKVTLTFDQPAVLSLIANYLKIII
jgi:hypothetical protein